MWKEGVCQCEQSGAAACRSVMAMFHVFWARHKAAVPARGRRGGVALVTAAALGPVSADAIAAYVDLGYG